MGGGANEERKNYNAQSSIVLVIVAARRTKNLQGVLGAMRSLRQALARRGKDVAPGNGFKLRPGIW